MTYRLMQSEYGCIRYFHELESQPLSDESIARGGEFMRIAEQRRQEEMAAYAAEKVRSLATPAGWA
jgi:hypothetical protein